VKACLNVVHNRASTGQEVCNSRSVSAVVQACLCMGIDRMVQKINLSSQEFFVQEIKCV
jgi:hypothetical protein